MGGLGFFVLELGGPVVAPLGNIFEDNEMIISQNSTSRILVLLVDGSDNPVTGVIPTDVLGSQIQIIKGDGTTVLVTLITSTNFFEVDSTHSPGLYQILLTNVVTNILGVTALSIQPSATKFVGAVIAFNIVTATTTDQLATDITTATSPLATSSQVSTVQTGVTAIQIDLTAISSSLVDTNDALLGTWKIFTSGTDSNRLVYYKQDGVTVLKKFNLLDISGNPNTINPFQRVGI